MREFFKCVFIGVCVSLSAHDPDIVKRYMQTETPVILDCGAHDGATARYWKNVFPGSKIYAVEADVQNARLLFQNVKGVKGIYPFHLLLSNVNGKVFFYPNTPGKGSAQGSIYKQSKECWYWDLQLDDVPIEVESKTLDQFCQDNGIEKIDFLFLDMQGGELQMLKGSPKVLSKATVICSEVLFEPIYVGAPLYSEIREFLAESGFEEIALFDYQSYGDAYFVRKGTKQNW